jgi:uracil-DNA glycosylase
MSNPYAQALDFLIDAGISVTVQDAPNNRFKRASISIQHSEQDTPPAQKTVKANAPTTQPLQPHSDIIKQAEDLAAASTTLDELKATIQNFDGLAIKKTATNIVFASGNPDASIMVIGDTPAAQDDRTGQPFMDIDGQLLDKIFDCIGLNRAADAPENALYLTNVLNWRPPGGRTPTDEELQISAPFIKRHIELVKPQFIICLGGAPAQILLQSKESISRLRGTIHRYNQTIGLIATYHPTSLLKTPLQKKKVWDDILMFKDAFHA